MSGLENLSIRLKRRGGNLQIERMNEDKLKSLKKALLYSYQSATACLDNGKEFRCLINPDMIKNTYDNKILSIPFEDVCLNENNKIEKIDIKAGSVFTWKENNSDWLVYLRRLEETAYFRAEIRRCKYKILIDNIEYKCYAARMDTNEIDWIRQNNKVWNDTDYTLQVYITKDETTEKFFHRFTIIEIDNKPWEVQSVDNMSSDGIIILYLKEWYKNTIQKEKEEEDIKNFIPIIPDENSIYISGPNVVYPYSKVVYYINNSENGKWEINNNKIDIIQQDDKQISLYINSSKSGEFKIKYIQENGNISILNIIINSLT